MPDFVTSSDPVLQFAILTGLVSIALAVLVFCGVLAMRARLLSMQRRRGEFNALWRPLLTRHALATDEPLGVLQQVSWPRLWRAERQFFLEEWNILHDLLRGEAKDRLNEIARLLNISPLVRRQLRHRRLSHRLLALVTLGHLREHAAWVEIHALLRDQNTLVALVSARALIGIDAEAAIPEILPVIMAREDWSTARVADLFAEAGATAVSGPLEEALRSSPPESVPKLIAVLPEVALPVSERIVSRLLRQPVDDRIKAICLRILENPRELPLVREYTCHDRWHLRMGAATVLGRLGVPEDREHLMRLLGDPQWWVRYRAGQALLAMPFVHRAELAELAESLPDPFARDILAHVLAERAT